MQVVNMKTSIPDFSDPSTQKRLSPASVLSFANIMKAWGVEGQDAVRLLGDLPLETYRAYREGADRAQLDEGLLTRISYAIGIFKALNIVHSQELADEWVRLPNQNSLFNGSTPLSYMIQGGVPAMRKVRQLLDARSVGN
jgi:hypothetical protein